MRPSLEREQITIAPDFAPAEAQPAWRQDFPIDWPQDLYVERRDFMKFLVLTSAAFTAGPVVDRRCRTGIGGERAAADSARRVASTTSPSAAAVVFTYPDEHEPCLLVRLTIDEFVAFSQKCTHLSCAVIPRPDRRQLLLSVSRGTLRSADGRARPPVRRGGR